MRIFFAVELPEDIKTLVNKLQAGLNAQAAVLSIPRDTHITLRFLGEANEADISRLREAMEQVRFTKFRLSGSGVGFFPDDTRMRVVWAGIKESRELMLLQSSVEGVLCKLSYLREKKFSPHITLARVKQIKDRKAFIASLPHVSEFEFTVDHFTLFSSMLLPSGAVYKRIFSVPAQDL